MTGLTQVLSWLTKPRRRPVLVRRAIPPRGACSFCGTSWDACDAKGEDRCCDPCYEHRGATHPGRGR